VAVASALPWASRTAVVNGIHTRSTSHDQSAQLVLTGYLDSTRADFAVMAAHHNGADLPLPQLLKRELAGPGSGVLALKASFHTQAPIAPTRETR
jgi:hypothetical protein